MEDKIKQLEIARDDLLVACLSVSVSDTETYRQAAELVKAIKDLKKEITDFFEPMKTQAYKAWKAICETEKEQLLKLEPAEKHLSAEMVAFIQEQEKKRREEEERIRQELLRQEEERRLAIAEELEKAGQKEEAERLIEEEVVVPNVRVENEVPKVEGLHYREDWQFEIEDESLIPREFLMPDEKKIRKYVKAMGETAKIPGVKIFKTKILVKG
jgi:hypothetical protein